MATSASGCAARSSASAGGMMLAAALGKAPTRRRGRSTPVDRQDLGLGQAQLGEDGLGVAQEDLARRRQRHPARVAHEQPRLELALEAGDLLGDRRLGEREGGRGVGERAARGDLAEDGEQARVEHNATLSVAEAQHHWNLSTPTGTILP